MTIPTISVICSASRPENWMGLYESIGENDVSIELVFVGPNRPTYDLPDNFRFIQSNVKPAQCWEIASRSAIGEYIVYVTDDLIYLTDRPMDKLYEIHKTSGNPNLVVSSMYNFPEGWNRFFSGDMDSPLVALCWMVPAKLWRELGGIDRRFVAVCWDIDMTMRVVASGGEILTSDVYIDEKIDMPNKPRSRGSTLYSDHLSSDRALLDSLWSTNGKAHYDRTLTFEPLFDKNLISRSQEPQGRWRYNNRFYNRIITGRLFYWLKTQRKINRGRVRRFRIRKIPTYVGRIFSR